MKIECHQFRITKYGTFNVGILEVDNLLGMQMLDDYPGLFTVLPEDDGLLEHIKRELNIDRQISELQYETVNSPVYEDGVSGENPVKSVAILIPYYEADVFHYCLLRALMDSIRRFLVKGVDYDAIIVVDDCSPLGEESKSYFQFLKESGIADVFYMGEPRKPFYNTQGRGIGKPGTVSFGHAETLKKGMKYLMDSGYTHAFIIDSDSIVLRGEEFLSKARQLFRYKSVVSVSDYGGGSPSEYDQIADSRCETSYGIDGQIVKRIDKATKPYRWAHVVVGFPNPCCMLLDLRASLSEKFHPFEDKGWVNAKWYFSTFWNGYKTAYYPFYQGKYVFHLGYASLLFTRKHDLEFGNSIHRGRYESKKSGEFYAGYMQCAMTRDVFVEQIKNQVLGKSFDEITRFDDSVLCEPPPEWHPREQDDYARPITMDDLYILERLFTQSGFAPYKFKNIEEMRDWIENKASRNHLSYFVYVKSQRVVGYGEIILSRTEDKKRFNGFLSVVIDPGGCNTDVDYNFFLFLYEYAKKCGAQYLYMYADIDNKNLLYLLRRVPQPPFERISNKEDYDYFGETRKRVWFRKKAF